MAQFFNGFQWAYSGVRVFTVTESFELLFFKSREISVEWLGSGLVAGESGIDFRLSQKY